MLVHVATTWIRTLPPSQSEEYSTITKIGKEPARVMDRFLITTWPPT